MFALIVLLIEITALVGMCGVVDHCFAALPKQFHRTPAKLIWLSVSVFVISMAGAVLAKNAPRASGIVQLTAVSVFFLVRGISFLGLSLSYRAFGRAHEIPISPAGVLMAVIASVADVLCVIAIVVMVVIQVVNSGMLSKEDLTHYENLTNGTLAGGMFLTVVFLLMMNANKNKVAAQERAERKAKLDTALAKKKIPRPATSATAPTPKKG